jgi:ferredoxin-NADP reductase
MRTARFFFSSTMACILVLLLAATGSLGQAIAYDWVVRIGGTSDGRDELELTLTANGDWYVGFGVAPSAMQGPIVTCYLPPSASEAMCSDWDGSGTDKGNRASRSTVVSTTTSGSSYTVVVRMTADSMGIVQGASQRVIFAHGSYSTGGNQPIQHASSGRGAATVDFYTRTVSAGQQTTPEPPLGPPPPGPETDAPAAEPTGPPTPSDTEPTDFDPTDAPAAEPTGPPTPSDTEPTVFDPTDIPVGEPPGTSVLTSEEPELTTVAAGEQPYMQIAGYNRVATSETVAVLGGSCTVKWRAYGLLDAEDVSASSHRFAAQQGASNAAPRRLLQVDLSAPVGQFMGLGVARSEMNGPLIVAALNPSNAVGLASDWAGIGVSSIQARAATTTVVQSSSGGGIFTTTVQFPADSLNIVPGKQRVIVSTGVYDFHSNTPLQHGGSRTDRDAIVLDFLAGTAGTEESHHYLGIAVAVVCAVCGVYLVVASALNFAKVVLSPNGTMLAQTLTVLLFIGLVAFYAAMRYLDHLANLKPYAVERSFGDATVFCFWFVLYPVPKHLGLLRLTGASWERLVPYHATVAFLVLVASTCHLIAMGLTMTDWQAQLVRTEGASPPLYGFLAWLCLLVMVICASTLRRIAYWLFKLSHMLFIPTLVFACLHYNPLIFALIPPLLNWLADLLWRAKGHCQAFAIISHARFHAKGGFTELTVTLSNSAARPGPGQFVLIGTTAAGFTADLHPFSVAWFDAKSNEALLCVKANGDGSWTRRLAKHIASSPAELPVSLVWVGPFGSLQVPLGKTPTCVLVAGGIAITALLSILQAVRERRDGGENVSRVVLLWSVREAALVDALQPLLTECATASTRDGSPFALLLELYHTSPTDQEDAAPPPFHTIARRRVDAANDIPRSLGRVAKMASVASYQQSLTSPSSSAVVAAELSAMSSEDEGSPNKITSAGERTTVYCCGPDGLTADVAWYCSKAPNTLLHTETFVL